ncbi:hypothetical protein B0H14DRAFT_2645142 [Mycena olivaceomarginata]|nr:hypothetical protein B0H14DRAFT_2645142 [Mycena olivaceomarginata]
MARTMHSGLRWSPWDLDALNDAFEVFQSLVTLAPYLHQALVSDDLRAVKLDSGLAYSDEEGWEDEDAVSSRPTMASLASLLALPSFESSAARPAPQLQATQGVGKKARRQKQRVAAAQSNRFGPLPKRRHSPGHEEAVQLPSFRGAELRTCAGGNWTGPRATKKARLTQRGVRRLRALLEDGHELIEWDGRLYWTLTGASWPSSWARPEGDDWDEVVREMERLMAGANVSETGQSRPFKSLPEAPSTSPFQPHHLSDQPGFSPAVLLAIYRNCTSTIVLRWAGILDQQRELEMPFPKLGIPHHHLQPRADVVTAEHLDMLNNPHGMCGVTFSGRYDHKVGGHIYLEQMKLVCEFPSGSMVLLLSGTCYAAGALFRWVAYGYQTAKSLLSQSGGAALKRELRRRAWRKPAKTEENQRESNISLNAQGLGVKPPSGGTFLSYVHTADHRYDHKPSRVGSIRGWNGETCEPWWPHIHPRRVLVERASVSRTVVQARSGGRG